jgi:glycosyltransferase involved in cell wall biosynthesis
MVIHTIHQFRTDMEYGDSITGGMFVLQRILQHSGYQSEIYCTDPDPRITQMLRPIDTFEERSTDLLLVHYSLGDNDDGWVSNLKCHRILVHHHASAPVQSLLEGNELAVLTDRSRAQLTGWAKARVFDAAIGHSTANVKELEKLGYRMLGEIPALLDLDRIRNHPWTDWGHKLKGSRNLLFVGCLTEHNGIIELIRVIERLRLISNLPMRLVLVGEAVSTNYLTAVENEIDRLGLAERVWLLGKLHDDDVYGLYRTSDLYITLSQHNCLEMQVMRSLIYDLPVVAATAEDVANTFSTGGLVLQSRDPDQIAAATKLVLEEPLLRRQIILGQRQSLARHEPQALVASLEACLRKAGVKVVLRARSESSPRRTDQWRIEGPFDSSYSLAIVNRELARALQRRGQVVALVSRDGPGPIKPNNIFLAENPDIAAMMVRGRQWEMPAVTLRNLYPPIVADMKGVMRVLVNYAWEESGFPAAHVEEFNATLDLICVAGRFVAKVLRDNGVHVPICVAGYGIDHVLGEPALRRRVGADHAEHDTVFRFLHISSGFPRKGLDALLAAWATEFSRDDAVMLAIKTFPNVHNRIEQDLAEWKLLHPSHAPVELINEDLSEKAVQDLYASADVVVCPSRGEGFGLPLAEALALGKAVITTAYGGQSDFCRADTAWLCDFSFAYARTHLGVFDSVWVEPNIGSLAKCLRDCYEAPPRERAARAEAGRALVRSQYRWDVVAERTQKAVAEVGRLTGVTLRLPKVGWVSTWNSRCGIAAYSQSLAAAIGPERLIVFANRNATMLEADEWFVRRCWLQSRTDPLDDLYQEIRGASVDVVVIQFNFGFYDLRSLGRLIERLAGDAIPVFVVLHSTADVEQPGISIRLRDAKQFLSMARRILVHSVHDLNRLKALGLIDNVALFPMGVPEPVSSEKKGALRRRLGLAKSRLVLASFGYLLPHKGLRELIRATALLRRDMGDVDLLMLNALYPIPESESEYQACRQEIALLGLNGHVTLVTDFLEQSEILARLAASDMVVYPYQETQESASAAVRFGLASLAPVVCTPLAIFDDVEPVISLLPGRAPVDLAEGLSELAKNSARLEAIAKRQRAWVFAHSWSRVGRRLDGLLRGEGVGRFSTPDVHSAGTNMVSCN